MPAYFPFFVNIHQKKIRVFGAGQVAARRIAALMRYGAEVTVIAPQIHKEIQKLQESNPTQLMIEQRSYRLGEIRNGDADYVFAATDDENVNTIICRESRHKEIPVNNASDSSQCDFYFPALVEQDQLVIGVTSTDGNHKKVAQFCERLRMQGTEDPGTKEMIRMKADL